MKHAHISSISLDAFAGRTRSHAFQPGVTAIIGANGAGKTTIANAVNFVLSGKVPGLPKTNQGLMDALGSSLRMGAAVTIGEATYDRSLIRSGKAIKGEARNPAPANLLPPTMLDLQPFLDASPKVRAGMILGACGDDVPGKLRALLAETGMERFTGKPATTDDVQEWLASVDELAKGTASGYAANIKDMRGTMAGMEVLDTSPLAYPAGRPISDLRAEVSRYEKEIATLEGEARAISARPAPVQPIGERPNGSADAFERQLAEAQASLRTAQADLARAQAEKQAWDRWQAEHARLEAKLAEAQQAYQVVADGWDADDAKDHKQGIADFRAKLAEQKARLRAAEASTLTGKATCPCCGAAREHWTTEAPAEDIEALRADIATTEKAIKQLETYLAEAEAVSRAADAVLRAQEALSSLHPQEAPAPGTEDLEVQAADLDESCAALQAEARKARAWDAYEASKAQHDADSARLATIGMATNNLRECLAAAKAQLAQAEARQAEQAQAEARQATRRQAEDRLAELEKDEAEFKAARLAWDSGVKAIMDEALRGVLDVCQTFTAGLFAAPLTVHSLALGRYEGNAWVPFDAFSGSDKRIATAAIQAALAVRHDGFKLVLIDEFGVIDPARKPAVLANLAAAKQAGLVDQVMMFDNRDIDGIPEGVNVMRIDSNN
jgi:energy-coupling factor transporter ATP-binding protein EcfA2